MRSTTRNAFIFLCLTVVANVVSTGPMLAAGVLAQFSAETQVVNNTLFIRALLDGVPGNPPESYLIGSGGLALGAGSMAFVFTGVAPGKHTLEMQMI